MIDPHTPALVLAPMEGVTDAPMRAVMGECGAFTHAVSEFLRISQWIPGRGAFHRHVPELLTGSRTPTGLPVQVQLLGGDPDRLAAAAAVAVEAGATAIDLNFGCPAPTVNRHDGGATLLKYPTRLRDIVRAVRTAVPQPVPVSAKLRLGWDDVRAIHTNAEMAVEGGASWLTIHARTRTQGYAPPVDWPLVGRIRQQVGIPVVANGDIHTLAGFRQCREETGCTHFMLGRGALANPELPRQVATELGLIPPAEPEPPTDWPARLQKLIDHTPDADRQVNGRLVHRMKQWLRMAAAFGDFRRFDAIKRSASVSELFATLGAA
jgi:tRNA-dihydrouridine synthase C